ncbi:hypothetical protein [Synechococcus sp. M16CYN]|uniref:hypothetical protein n=1 Tax=Synechococcus sp. M16CYN TaxID=3103139 RepID=UPI003342BF4A
MTVATITTAAATPQDHEEWTAPVQHTLRMDARSHWVSSYYHITASVDRLP